MTGGIIGLIVGDALGVPAEFKSRERLRDRPVTGMTGHGTHNQPPGTWSDDSSLALATMESLLDGYDPVNMMARFSRWLASGYMTPHGTVFDAGNTTVAAIERFDRHTDRDTWGGSLEYDNGNGSLMRILPVSLCFYAADIPTLIARNFEVSALTHAHIRSRLCCAYYSLLLRRMLSGASLEVSMARAAEDLDSHVPPDERPHLERILTGSVLEEAEEHIRGSGYVVHCLEASLWCANRFDRYEDAVLAAVNLGEDTDTTAAVTGGLVGVRDGIDAVPAEWRDALARAGDVKALIRRFVDLLCVQ